MSTNLISIDIGSGSIAMVQGTVLPNTIDITKTDISDIKKGSVVNGAVRDKAEISSIIDLLYQRKGFSAKRANLTLNAGNALMREFNVPIAKPKQLEAIVKNEMVNTYMAGPEDIVEFKKIDDVTAEDGTKSLLVRAVAMNKELIDEYYKTLLEAKLKPDAMDFNANAIEKLIQRKPLLNEKDMTDKSYIILDFGYSGIMTYIVSSYTIYASRFIPIGINDIELAVSGGTFLPDEGEPAKLSELLDFSDELAKESIQMSAAYSVMLECSSEVEKVLMYIVSRLPQDNVSDVFIYGGGSSIPGIDKYFSKALNAEAQVLKTVSAVTFKNPQDEANLPYCLNAIGALIRL